MHLPQIATLVATALALLGVIFRQMGLVRAELNARIDSVRGEINGTRTELDAKIDGTNARIDGLRSEMSAKFDGLRNELLATMQPMTRLLERLDQDARDHLKTHHSSG
ncbi:apolipoprotein A1/A4/E family protein [Actinomadura rupiterrae]|uniref:apolipoprotein A1/A4/E family protein n=1 Tax=Actinomadura rupiterrae TaxID=559627 RepID=UPI0020A359DB|nr:apolipoprotein A1/A4/E family protein [Actinomadura rupiterrae]MCP2336719.1 uncharacterized small protein (DUF1192 family) [Actinomadura rupiterrae]